MFNYSTPATTLIIAATVLLLVFIPVPISSLSIFGKDITPAPQNSTLESILVSARRSAFEDFPREVARKSYKAGQESIIVKLNETCLILLDETLAQTPVMADMFRFSPADWFKIAIAGLVLFFVGSWINDSWYRKALCLGGGISEKIWQKLTPKQQDDIVLFEKNRAKGPSSPMAPVIVNSNGESTALVITTPGEYEVAVEERAEAQTSCSRYFNIILLTASIVALVVLGRQFHRFATVPTYHLTGLQYWWMWGKAVLTGFGLGDIPVTREAIHAGADWIINSALVICGFSGATILNLLAACGPRCLRRRIKKARAEARAAAAVAAAATDADVVVPGGPGGPSVPDQRRPVASAPPLDSDDEDQ